MENLNLAKRIIIMAIIAGIILSTCGCADRYTTKESSSSQEFSGEQYQTSKAVPAPPKVTILKLATTLTPDNSMVKAMYELSDLVSERTNGSVDIQIFPSSQLGDQMDYIEGMGLGTIEMCIIGISALESYEPKFAIYTLPFVYESQEHIHNFFDSDISQELLDGFRDKQHIRILAPLDEGFRNVWTKDTPIRTVDDFAKLTVRVPDVPVYMNLFSALGSHPVPMGWGDTYTALQTSMINAVENNIEMVLSSNLQQTLKYNNITGHTYSMNGLAISETVFEELSPSEQIILLECTEKIARKRQIEFARTQRELEASLKDMGIETITLPEEELEKIKLIMQDVIAGRLGELYDISIIDRIQEMK